MHRSHVFPVINRRKVHTLQLPFQCIYLGKTGVWNVTIQYEPVTKCTLTYKYQASPVSDTSLVLRLENQNQTRDDKASRCIQLSKYLGYLSALLFALQWLMLLFIL